VRASLNRAVEAPAKSVERAVSRVSHEVRIIGGQWKRTKLKVANKAGLRPTPDRVRETLFNWLGQDLSGWRCVDVFAGTGALGFEAASRGAREVKLVESDKNLIAQLEAVKLQLTADKVQVIRGDGVGTLKGLGEHSIDLVFLDPPFDSLFFDAALQAASLAITDAGFVYLEAPQKWPDEKLRVFRLATHRYLKAGAVHAHLLKRAA
jgi:16S rRNA (guanine966-N2)-methyltransferase